MSSYVHGEDDYQMSEAGAECGYPNCRFGRIDCNDPHTQWDTTISLEEIYQRVPPIVKLAIQENLEGYQREQGVLFTKTFMHPECSAEWGMHLIKEGIHSKSTVGRILSNRSPQEKTDAQAT